MEELKLWYKRISGIELDLENPKTYNEKIQWLKLYDSTPLKTRLSDKYLVRDWVTEKIGEEYLIPLLGVWDDFDEIDFDQLPNQFVLKANHGCGWNIIVRDKCTFAKDDAREKFNKWMNTNFAFHFGLELQYLNIQPKIIAEEYIENRDQDLYDYKVFCFDGKANSVMFLSERQHGLKMAFYDLQWNKLPFVYSYPQNDKEIPRPKNLDLMIGLSEKLSAEFPHVRVDFYILNDGSLKFGEMTFTSASGSCKWDPPEQNRIFGDLITLPTKNSIPKRIS
ncbi:MAG: ATP-grasp fold amidoligase family protein [Pseudomonadota bacterium]|nr:ATP-grasp fold amidoligase family protein [Pseudomonadota bacterium]